MKKPRKPKYPTHYGNRFDVTVWMPVRELMEAAHERTEGMVGYFLSCARRHDPLKWQDDLGTLARSCYLQGAADAALVAAKIQRTKDEEVIP